MVPRTFRAGPITDEKHIDIPLAVIAAHQTHEWLINHSARKDINKDIRDVISHEEENLSNHLKSNFEAAKDEIQKELSDITSSGNG